MHNEITQSKISAELLSVSVAVTGSFPEIFLSIRLSLHKIARLNEETVCIDFYMWQMLILAW